MPGRIRARVVLAALLIVLTVSGIQAVGPGIGWSHPARSVVVAVACGLEVTLALLLITLRWRRPAVVAPASPGSGDVGTRLRSILSSVIVAGLIAVPLASLIGLIGTWRNGRRLEPRLRPPPVGFRRLRPAHAGHAAASLAVVRNVFFVLLIIGILALGAVLWRYRWSRRFRSPGVDDDDDLLPDTPADLARAVGSGRTALRQLDDARTAIIRCYLAMEASLADAGAARAIAETPDELLARAVASGLVGAAPAMRLTRLFYEARFSTHLMPPSRREDAEQALAELAATLPDQPGGHQTDQPGGPSQPAAETSAAGG